MNREIRFRGCDKNGKWYYSLLLYKESRSLVPEIVISYTEKVGLNTFNMKVLPDTIGQFTGLKDAKGKDIYEGDILRLTIPDGSIRHFVVEWATEDRKLMPLSRFEHDGNDIRISGWCFNWNGHRLYPTVIDGIPDNEVMTIVGNIHDNPELLKGGE
jgi:hypothetical protein